MADNIKVCIKMRPLIRREKENNAIKHWKINNNYVINVENPSTNFLFDFAFDENTTTRELFDIVAKPIVQSSLKGFNGTIFAYGQTSSGKTHTMTGTDEEIGVIGLTVTEIFKEIKSSTDREFLLRVGYIEIYNEKINDLLDKKNIDLKIHETSSGNVVVNCKEYVTNSVEQIIEHMKVGNKTKRIGETNMNDRSSRSHTIFRIIIESRVCKDDEAITISQLNLVDLAGSERADQTGANSFRLKEGAHINKSLLSLSCVIQKLSEDESLKFVNYRDSKLTRILQASLGGNALTSIICTVTPATLDETMSTLNFAMRAKTIKNKPTINEELSGETMTKRLKNEIILLRNQLEEEKNKNSKMQILKQISEMETQFLHSHSSNTETNNKNRRRTWCPSTITNHMSKLPVPQPVSNGQHFLNPAIPKSHIDYINLRNRESMPVLSINDDFADEIFVPAEEILFDKSPKFNRMVSEIRTPETFKSTNIIEPTITPDHTSWKEKCVLLDQELRELKDFTKLENKCDITQKLNENYDKINFYEIEFAKMKSNLTKKDIQIDLVQAKCAEMENKLLKVQNDLEVAIKEKDVALKEKQLAESHQISIEYEFEQFKMKTKSRESELLHCLNEKRVDDDKHSSIDKIKDLEAKLLKLEETNYNLQSETDKINKMYMLEKEALETTIRNQLSVFPEPIESEAREIRETLTHLECNLKKYETDKNIISDENLLVLANNFKNKQNLISETNLEEAEFSTFLYKNEDGDFKNNCKINELDKKVCSMTLTNDTLKNKIIELESALCKKDEHISDAKKLETVDACVETDFAIDNKIENKVEQDLAQTNQDNENLNKKLNDTINALKEKNKSLQNEYEELSNELMDNIQENESLKESSIKLKEKIEAYEITFKLEKENYNKQTNEMELNIKHLTEYQINSIQIYEKVLKEKNAIEENYKKLEIDHKVSVSQLQSYEQEIKDLNNSFKELKVELQKSKDYFDETSMAKVQLEKILKMKIVSLEESIENLMNKPISENKEMAALQEMLQEYEAKEYNVDQLNAVLKEKEQLEINYKKLKEENDISDIKLKEVESEYQNSKEQFNEFILEKDELLEKLNTKILSLEENIDTLNKNTVNERCIVEEKIKMLEEMELNLTKLSEEREQLDTNNNELKEEYEILREKMEKVDDDYEKIKNRHDELMMSKDKLTETLKLKIKSLEENVIKLENDLINEKKAVQMLDNYLDNEKKTVRALEEKLNIFEEKKYMFDLYSETLSKKDNFEIMYNNLIGDYENLKIQLKDVELGNKNTKNAYHELSFNNSTTETLELDSLKERLKMYEEKESNFEQLFLQKDELETNYNKLKDEYENLKEVEADYQIFKDKFAKLSLEAEIKKSEEEESKMNEIELLKERLKLFEEKEYSSDQYSEIVKEKEHLEINYTKLKGEYDILEQKVLDIEGVESEKRCILLEAVESISDEKEEMRNIISTFKKKISQYEFDLNLKNEMHDKIKSQASLQENENKLMEYRMINIQKNVNEYEQKCYKLEESNQRLNKDLNDMKDIMATNLTNYSLYQEKLELNIASLSASNELLQKELNTTKDNMELLKCETDERVFGITNEMDSLRIENTSKLQQVECLTKKNLQLHQTIDVLKSENLNFDNKIKSIETSVETTKDTINGLLYTLDKLKIDFNEKKNTVNKLQQTISDFDHNYVHVENIRVQLDNCEREKLSLEAQLVANIKEMQANEETIKNLTVKLQSIEEDNISYLEINKNLQKDKENIELELTELKKNINLINGKCEEKSNNAINEKNELIKQLELFRIKNTEVEAILEKELKKYTEQNQKLSDLKKQNEELFNTINENNTKLCNLDKLIQEQNDAKSIIISELEAKISSIPILEEEMKQIIDQKLISDHKVKEQDILITDLKHNVKNLTNKLKDSKLEMEKQNQNFVNHLTEKESVVQTIEKYKIEISTLTKKITDLELRLNESENSIRKLNEEKLLFEIEKQQSCNNTKSEISALKISIESLSHFKEINDAQQSNLNSKNLLLLEKNTDNENKIVELTSLCEEYRSKISTNKDQIKKLIIRVEELIKCEKDLNALKERQEKYSEIDCERLIAENCDLIKKVHELNAEYSLINSQYHDLEDEYNLVTSTYNKTLRIVEEQNQEIVNLKQMTIENDEAVSKNQLTEKSIKSSNVLLVKQLHEMEKMHLYKINKYEKQLNEMKLNESKLQESINQHEDELKLTLKKYSAIETELNALKLKAASPTKNDKALELQTKLKELNHERKETLKKEKVINNLLGENNELKSKNQHLILEIDNFRRLTKNDRKSRRQSAHDEKRQLWDYREIETMTDPTDDNCSCNEMNSKINDLKRDIVIKDSHISTMQLMYKHNPFQDEIKELKESLKKSDRIIQELRSERGKSCTECIKSKNKLFSSKCIQTDIKLDGGASSEIDAKEYELLKTSYANIQSKYAQAKQLCINRKHAIDNNLEVQTYKRLLSDSEQKYNKLKDEAVSRGKMNKSVQTEKNNDADLKEKYVLMKNIALKRKEKIVYLENMISLNK